jgi:hemerythrin superfamily protein
MNAIALLKSQHRDVERLFARFEIADTDDEREDVFTQIADALAIHSSIEEHHFYPTVRERRTEEFVDRALEEHLDIKCTLSDLLDLEPGDAVFEAKMEELQQQVAEHVAEEENDLFPKVEKLLDADELESIGITMSAEQSDLEERGNARELVPGEVEQSTSVY